MLVPSDDALLFATADQIAVKDVPKGFPYKIVSSQVIPKDRTHRDAWEWDSTITPDGFGGNSSEFDAETLAKHKELSK